MPDPTSGLCVYCGTERPVADERCPHCGRPWVDHSVAAPAPDAAATPSMGRVVADMTTTGALDTGSSAAEIVLEADEDQAVVSTSGPETEGGITSDVPPETEGGITSDVPPETPPETEGGITSDVPPETPPETVPAAAKKPAKPIKEHQPVAAPDRNALKPRPDGAGRPPPTDRRPVRWLIPVGIALVVLVVYAIIFAVLLSRSDRQEVAAPITTTSRAIDSTTTTTSTTSTTRTTTTPTTTLAPETTTATLPPIPASGQAIPSEDLVLGAFRLGPIDFGDAATDAAGLLVATLGQPDTYFSIGENFGLCPTEEGRALVWGGFTAILRNDGAAEVLVAYRLDGGATAHPTQSLKTLSGIGIADDVNMIELAYAQSRVTFLSIDDKNGFLVSRSGDDRTLLWGLLTEESAGEVTTLASPRPCDGGPFADG